MRLTIRQRALPLTGRAQTDCLRDNAEGHHKRHGYDGGRLDLPFVGIATFDKYPYQPD